MSIEIRYSNKKVEYRENGSEWTIACSGLIEVTPVDNWEERGSRLSGLLIRVRTKSRARNWLFLSASELRSGRACIPRLCDSGLKILNGKPAEAALLQHLQRLFDKPQATLVVQKAGWQDKGSAYITSNGRAIGGSTPVLLQPALLAAEESTTFSSMDAWQSEVGPTASQSTTLIVAVALSLGACLLKGTRQESFWLHIYGDSSIGKTLMLMLAYSIFHKAQRGKLPTMDFTEAGLEDLACKHDDQVVVLDELDQLAGDSRERSKRMGLVIHRIAGGASRLRSKRYDPQHIFTWRTIVFSSGEISLAQLNSTAGRHRNAGEALRVIDLPAITTASAGIFDRRSDGESGRTLANRLEHAIERNGCVLGPAFVHAMQKDLRKYTKEALRLRDEFLQMIGVKQDTKTLRYASKFALGYAAGVLASRLGILNWTEELIGDAFKTSYYTASNDALSPDNAIDGAIATVRRRCERPERFVCSKAERTRKTYGYLRKASNGHCYYLISPSRLQKWSGAGIYHAEVALELKAKGILKSGADGKLTRQARIEGEALRRRYYWLRASSFESDQQERKKISLR